MNWKLKRSSLMAGIIAGLLLLTSVPATAEQQSQSISVYYAPIHFVFEGKELAPPEGQSGFIYEGSTYVPLRFISYALNKGVEWDGATYTVSVQAPTTQQKIEIQDYRLNREVRTSTSSQGQVVVPDPTQIDVYFEKVKYLFDNMEKQPSDDLPGLIYENSLYVPMRFFSESIGKKIDWDPVTYTVSAEPSATVQPTVPKPTPTPTPTLKPPVVTPPVSIPGAGGGVVTKPSIDSLKAPAVDAITSLKADAENYFTDLSFQFIFGNARERAELKSKGIAKLAEFDSRFESIMGDLASKLTANGYSLELIDSYRQDYANEKARAQAMFG